MRLARMWRTPGAWPNRSIGNAAPYIAAAHGKSGFAGSRIRRKPEAPAVEPSLADDHAGGLGFHAIESQPDGGESIAHCFEQRLEDVGALSQRFFQRKREAMHHLRVEADPKHLHEQPIFISGMRQSGPKLAGASERQRRRHRVWSERQAEFVGQHVRCAQRNNAEARLRSHQPVGDLRDRAIATGGDDKRRAAPHRFPRQRLGMTGALRFREVQADSVGDEHVEHAPQQMGAPSPRDRIENDNHILIVTRMCVSPYACFPGSVNSSSRDRR
jgi:hypothetical protein